MAESGEDGVHGQEQKLKRLKFLRRGKKAAITIRIQKLEKLIGEMGSRRMVRGLLTALQKVFDELQEVCYNISLLSEDDDLNCIEMVRLDIDTCATLQWNTWRPGQMILPLLQAWQVLGLKSMGLL